MFDAASGAWRDKAACREHDIGLWFPGKPGGPAEVTSPREALRICQGCDVQGPCLEFALESGESVGVWGRTTPNQRRRLLRQRSKNGVQQGDAVGLQVGRLGAGD